MQDFEVGDKVWVLCKIEEVHPAGEILVSGLHEGEFYVSASDCRPIEPSVIKDCLITEPNAPKILDTSSGATGSPWVAERQKPARDEAFPSEIQGVWVEEAVQVGDKARFIKPGHRWDGVRGYIASVSPERKRPYEFRTNCGKFIKYCDLADLEYIDPTDAQLKTPDKSNSPKILDISANAMQKAFEADIGKRYGWNKAYFARNEYRYFDGNVELLWLAWQGGVQWAGMPSNGSLDDEDLMYCGL
jgi:hypothetical protein